MTQVLVMGIEKSPPHEMISAYLRNGALLAEKEIVNDGSDRSSP
jgi:hypothetical protein